MQKASTKLFMAGTRAEGFDGKGGVPQELIHSENTPGGFRYSGGVGMPLEFKHHHLTLALMGAWKRVSDGPGGAKRLLNMLSPRAKELGKPRKAKRRPRSTVPDEREASRNAQVEARAAEVVAHALQPEWNPPSPRVTLSPGRSCRPTRRCDRLCSSRWSSHPRGRRRLARIRSSPCLARLLTSYHRGSGRATEPPQLPAYWPNHSRLNLETRKACLRRARRRCRRQFLE